MIAMGVYIVSGHFGKVFEGKLWQITSHEWRKVALKTIKGMT